MQTWVFWGFRIHVYVLIRLWSSMWMVEVSMHPVRFVVE